MNTVNYYKNEHLHPFDLTGYAVFQTVATGIVNPYEWNGRCRMPAENFSMYRGNDRTVRVFAKTPDLDIVDLTGAVGIMTLRDRKGDTVLLTRATNVVEQGEIGAADEGEMLFYFAPADTASMEIRQYAFDVTVTLSGGKRYTILEGVMELKEV